MPAAENGAAFPVANAARRNVNTQPLAVFGDEVDPAAVSSAATLLREVEAESRARGSSVDPRRSGPKMPAIGGGRCRDRRPRRRGRRNPSSAKALARRGPPCRRVLIALTRQVEARRADRLRVPAHGGRGATARQVSVTSRRSARGPMSVTADRISSSGATGAKCGRSLAPRRGQDALDQRFQALALFRHQPTVFARVAASLREPLAEQPQRGQGSAQLVGDAGQEALLPRGGPGLAARARRMAARQTIDPPIAAQSAKRKARSRGPSGPRSAPRGRGLRRRARPHARWRPRAAIVRPPRPTCRRARRAISRERKRE
jgi:hypothetical protein